MDIWFTSVIENTQTDTLVKQEKFAEILREKEQVSPLKSSSSLIMCPRKCELNWDRYKSWYWFPNGAIISAQALTVLLFRSSTIRVATNLKNMENLDNSGNLKNCQNLRENSGKFEHFWKKPGKLRENETCDMIANKNALIEFFSLELLREKVENILENSGNLVSQKCDHPDNTNTFCFWT